MKTSKRKPKKTNSTSWLYKLGCLCALSIFIVSCAPDDLEPPASYQERYVGIWDCEETTGINAPQFYTLNISAGSGEDELVINNLYGEPTTLTAYISGLNISIPTQTSMGITFNGSGKANASFDQIVLNFSADDGAATDQVRAILHPN
jgi:hypothetical protein